MRTDIGYERMFDLPCTQHAEPLVVSVPDLRSPVVRVLNATEELLGLEANLPANYYWHLPVEDAFDLTSEPRTLTMDSSSRTTQRHFASTGTERPDLVWHALSHLVGVLRALELAARSGQSPDRQIRASRKPNPN